MQTKKRSFPTGNLFYQTYAKLMHAKYKCIMKKLQTKAA